MKVKQARRNTLLQRVAPETVDDDQATLRFPHESLSTTNWLGKPSDIFEVKAMIMAVQEYIL
jgi:hypothetical protein